MSGGQGWAAGVIRGEQEPEHWFARAFSREFERAFGKNHWASDIQSTSSGPTASDIVATKRFPRMRWPRGRRNGKRIVGFSVKCSVDLSNWLALPHWELRYAKFVSWLCLSVWFNLEYED